MPGKWQKNSCVVKGCASNVLQNPIEYFAFPDNRGPMKSKKRKWLEAIGTDNVPADARICARHFILGQPSKESEHPDYIPRLNLNQTPTFEMNSIAELNEELRKSNTDWYKPNKKNDHGFKRNLTPEKILGITQLTDGRKCFLMKWEDDLAPDFVLASDANENCPHIVIDFYEDLTTWAK